VTGAIAPLHPLRLDPRSPSWPRELDDVDPVPECIWIAGCDALLAHRPRIAVVGSRSPTPYGEAQATRFATSFARAGACVVSGLARGIDQAAHAAALAADGPTVAVLGCGVDRPWPAGRVTDEVARLGLLLSEFPPGQGPRPHHFPLRNRLISGLCSAVVVIEAAQASGSLITARWAADQGRDVYALPGRVDHPMARGTHRLIREGAQLVEAPEEVLEALGLVAAGSSHASGSRASRGSGSTPRPTSRLLATLVGETLTADEVAERLDRPLAPVLAELALLELDGALVRGPGGLYRLP